MGCGSLSPLTQRTPRAAQSPPHIGLGLHFLEGCLEAPAHGVRVGFPSAMGGGSAGGFPLRWRVRGPLPATATRRGILWIVGIVVFPLEVLASFPLPRRRGQVGRTRRVAGAPARSASPLAPVHTPGGETYHIRDDCSS